MNPQHPRAWFACMVAAMSLAAITACGTATQTSPSTTSKTPKPPPNIVWLISEDNSAHFSRLYRPQGAAMPTVEAMAEQGLVFEQAYSNAPVCSTARSTLALGAYGPRVGTVYHRARHKATLPQGLVPLSQLMQAAGYYTTNKSKEDYNFSKDKAVWNDSSRTASWRNRAAGQPFFHVQSFQITHEIQAHFDAADVSSVATQHDPNTVELLPYHPDTELFRYSYARYLDQHSKLDQQLAKVIDDLRDDGELENTFIFYFGDHGGILPGTKGYLSEAGLHVPLVVRVPKHYKHVLGEGLNADGQRLGGVVSFIDFAPTVLALAQQAQYAGHDGSPFLGELVSLSDIESKNEAFAYADRFDEKMDFVRSLRVGDYKYIRSYTPYYPDGLENTYRFKQAAYREWRELYQKGELNDLQARFFVPKPAERLYKVSDDPNETTNLATDKAHQKTLLSMRAALRAKQTELFDLGFYPEAYLAEAALADTASFKQHHARQHQQLMDIADLTLLPWSKAKKQLKAYLDSGDEWQVYRSLQVLSHFGRNAKGWVKHVERFAESDQPRLLRARAMEFIAIAKNGNPNSLVGFEALLDGATDLEALEVLNVAAYLHTQFDHDFAFDTETLTQWPVPDSKATDYKPRKTMQKLLQGRIDYVNGKAYGG